MAYHYTPVRFNTYDDGLSFDENVKAKAVITVENLNDMEEALKRKIPMIAVTASGGARMQESILSLMQMAKTSCAVAKLNEAGLLYITVLTEPTFGGVTASFATIGDIIIAEKDARIGFAGRRVIEQTIRQSLPADFQTANYLMKYGQIDMISSRAELKSTISKLINLHKN